MILQKYQTHIINQQNIEKTLSKSINDRSTFKRNRYHKPLANVNSIKYEFTVGNRERTIFGKEES